ncbi:hypothetical protein B7R54_13865 [Subtercola boreus]|uniref:Multidrug transporter n=1 Tax=Subtercola boreus TaxID=120213 RepID=A0A3E0VJP1_9MICO|nr:hypothetical protein [Subtercola boreus]RFA10172.1 hypothetical protein B7R54_13865 [Subtercola boreus]TQL52662.1 hypothetical protein FB464_0145 [Subtercola boreus]
MTPDVTEPTDADTPADAPAGIPPGDGDFAAARREQLLTAPGADERDAAPRIDVSEVAPNTKRIDVRGDAAFRPGS